jgi:hypothetical protein
LPQTSPIVGEDHNLQPQKILEYFTFKKIKNRLAEKHAIATHAKEPIQSLVLSEEDEPFIERIASEEGTPLHLSARPHILNPDVIALAADSTNNDAQVSMYPVAK